MIYLSASSIRDFIHCSKMFYYRTNFSEEAVDTPEAIVGTIVHKAIEDHWKSYDQAMQYCKFKATEFNLDLRSWAKIEASMTAFFSLIPEIYGKLKDNDLKEYKFKEKIGEDVTLVGKMDRIIVDDGIVIDWKTGKTKNVIDNDIQFIIYYMMYNRAFGKFPGAVYQISLSGKNIITAYQPNKEYINALFNHIIPSIVERVKKNKFNKEGYFNNSCYSCNYIGLCNKDPS